MQFAGLIWFILMILPLVSVTKLPRTVPSGAFTSKVAPERCVFVPVSSFWMMKVVLFASGLFRERLFINRNLVSGAEPPSSW